MSTLFVAFEDFMLSREAALCSPETIDFYRRMFKPFLAFADGSPRDRLASRAPGHHPGRLLFGRPSILNHEFTGCWPAPLTVESSMFPNY